MTDKKEAVKIHDDFRRASKGCNNGRLCLATTSTEPAAKKKDKQVDKLAKLVEVMRALMTQEFTGHIKINFSQGGIGRVEKFEEILKATTD